MKTLAFVTFAFMLTAQTPTVEQSLI